MQLTDEQFNLIKEQFKTLKDRSPFYAKKFEDIDLSDCSNFLLPSRILPSCMIISMADAI